MKQCGTSRAFCSTGVIAALLLAVNASYLTAASPSSTAVTQLRDYLKTDDATLGQLSNEPFAATPLSREDAAAVRALIWESYARQIRSKRTAEMKERKVTIGKLEMPFFYRIFGEKPKGGRSLFISLHGGGGAPKQVNDGQWENQKRLYSPKEGVYLVPRAPTNTWNLWHQAHIDQFFDRLITSMIVFEDVNPDRVYVMGYSAGGDGIYQIAPRMADRWAAAAMMAGHPNDASPLSLRNTAFTLHVGGRDAAYNRNKVALQWQETLAELRRNDPKGYAHFAKIYPDKGHWLDREDAAAVPWMAEHSRRTFPDRIVWRQDDITHSRFYWLAVDDEQRRHGTTIVAERKGQKIHIESSDVAEVSVLLNDDMVDLDNEITVTIGDAEVFRGRVDRTASGIAETTLSRGDRRLVYSARIGVSTKKDD